MGCRGAAQQRRRVSRRRQLEATDAWACAWEARFIIWAHLSSYCFFEVGLCSYICTQEGMRGGSGVTAGATAVSERRPRGQG